MVNTLTDAAVRLDPVPKPLDTESLFLAHLVRQAMADGVTSRMIAERATQLGHKLSHATVINLKNHKEPAGHRTRKALLAYFGLTAAQLEARAKEWALANPDALPRPPETRVEYDEPDRPRFGSLPGWKEAEQQARRMARGTIPDEAWRMAAEAAGARVPVVTPLFVLELARAFAGALASEDDESE